MTHYDTLDAALADIAKRSFYEDATVTPIPRHSFSEGTFTGTVTCDHCGLLPLDSDDYDSFCGFNVDDDYATSFAGDQLMMSENGDVEWPSNAADHSRVHEDYEFYDNAEQIKYNLADAVAALESGREVTFSYAIVDTECEEEDGPNAHAGSCCLNCDSAGWQTAGWALLAAIHGETN